MKRQPAQEIRLIPRTESAVPAVVPGDEDTPHPETRDSM